AHARGAGLVHIGFRPCEVIAFFGRAFSNTLVNELTRRSLKPQPRRSRRSRHEPRTMLLVPACDCHMSEVSPRALTNKSWDPLALCRRWPIFCLAIVRDFQVRQISEDLAFFALFASDMDRPDLCASPVFSLSQILLASSVEL